MEGFSYHDIFATKGVEYLVIIAFLALLIPFSIILSKQPGVTSRIKKVIGTLTSGLVRVPQGLLFSKLHTWAHLDKTGFASVGVDDLVMHLTGPVTFTRIREAGETIRKGDPLAVMVHDGRWLRLFSPISGEILEANPLTSENPQVVNDDPFGAGWLYRIKPSNWIAETSTCFLADEASAWSRQELDRVKDFLAVTMKRYSPDMPETVLQDGGELRDHTFSLLPEEVWEDFEKSFLSPR